ncbi:2-dehydro-3-deoxygalactonokinase [Microbulbifer thermotolerans]|uniref:2-dehydro-3-deoxygalactonokinase n=2 Tax=Microbulbifer thermotolerans TaxID=252514 RepID=UPI002248BC22|nr:2-dehydro-3-deoxygalactonokinase [Microbulbifer thermotolerans]MCX2831034.1 2-dehydro-3-deoxygalactonokinase [Microbulbifer thermotolerans]
MCLFRFNFHIQLQCPLYLLRVFFFDGAWLFTVLFHTGRDPLIDFSMPNTDTDIPAIIAVDWGSSNFRAFLLDREGRVLAERLQPQGMLTLAPSEFETFLLGQITAWLQERPMPVLMAGMVGSAQGWRDAGYVDCPLPLSELGRKLCKVDNSAGLPMAIVPGIRGVSFNGLPDVMRGEEVQLLGAVRMSLKDEETDPACTEFPIYCLPGTHSKWVRLSKLEGGHDKSEIGISDFTTFMTGELFSLLVEKSIIGRAIPQESPVSPTDTFSRRVFERGVDTASAYPDLLHTLFSARSAVISAVTNSSLTLAPEEVRSYLSGLLIGTEIHTVVNSIGMPARVTLVGGGNLTELYRFALERRGIHCRCLDGSDTVRNGLFAIATQAGMIDTCTKGVQP